MSEFTIYLDHTNKEQFCEWLNSYAKKMGMMNSPKYPYMGGASYQIGYYDVYQKSKVNFSALVKQPVIPNMQPPLDDIWVVNIYDPEENVTYSVWEWEIKDVLGLVWLEVGKRLKLIMNYDSAKWIIPPVFQFLWAIKTDYPETSEKITRYIVEKSDWWNLAPPYSLENDAAMAYIIAEQAREEINNKSTQSQEYKTIATIQSPAVGTAAVGRNEQGQEIIGGTANPGQMEKLLRSLAPLVPPKNGVQYPIYEVTEGKALDFISLQDEMQLVCNKREFRTWFEHQYSEHVPHYKDTPDGAVFSILTTHFTLQYSVEEGKHKYIFDIKELVGHSRIREDFIGTVRNTFELSMEQVSTGKMNDRRQRGKSGRPHLSEDKWAWEQVNQNNRPMNEVYTEWLEKIKVNPERCNMVDPKRQFSRITKPGWGNKSGQNI